MMTAKGTRMKRMGMLAVAFLTCTFHLAPGSSGVADDSKRGIDPGWLTDIEAALSLSDESGKPILAQFTGSDWCGWCKKMDAEVFGTAQFRNWARDHVVLLEVDFPRRKHQTPMERERNQQLQDRFRVSGYPTVVFMTTDKKELGRVASYKPIEAFLEKAREILEKQKGTE